MIDSSTHKILKIFQVCTLKFEGIQLQGSGILVQMEPRVLVRLKVTENMDIARRSIAFHQQEDPLPCQPVLSHIRHYHRMPVTVLARNLVMRIYEHIPDLHICQVARFHGIAHRVGIAAAEHLAQVAIKGLAVATAIIGQHIAVERRKADLGVEAFGV